MIGGWRSASKKGHRKRCLLKREVGNLQTTVLKQRLLWTEITFQGTSPTFFGENGNHWLNSVPSKGGYLSLRKVPNFHCVCLSSIFHHVPHFFRYVNTMYRPLHIWKDQFYLPTVRNSPPIFFPSTKKQRWHTPELQPPKTRRISTHIWTRRPQRFQHHRLWCNCGPIHHVNSHADETNATKVRRRPGWGWNHSKMLIGSHWGDFFLLGWFFAKKNHKSLL